MSETQEAGGSRDLSKLIGDDQVPVAEEGPSDTNCEDQPPLSEGTGTSKRIRCSCWPPYEGNKEALGWALDSIGRSVSFIASAVFVGTALLNLAKQAAGCDTEPPEGETEVPECNGRVYGIRPSSLLTTYSTVVALVSSALLPLMGAIVDHTDCRLAVGRVSAAIVCVLLFPLIFVSEETWFALAIVVLILAFAGWIHTAIAFAYLPEITDDPDLLVKYTASFTVIQYASTVGFLIFMIGLLTALGLNDDEVAASRIAQIISTVVTTGVFGYSWAQLFDHRSAFSYVPEDSTLLTAGFKKVYRTTIAVYNHYRALKWFYVAVSFSDAAAQSLATIAITYLTDQLQFSATENGIAILIMFIGTIPGALASKYFTFKLNPLLSAKLCLFLLTISTVVAACILTGPGQQGQTYVIAAFWGIGIGWKYTSERYIVCRIIPKGQDAELMGYYLFAGQILVWLPSLIFTILNESGVSKRIGIACVGCFFFSAIIALFFMGNYDDAVAAAASEDEEEDQGAGGADGNESKEEISAPCEGEDSNELELQVFQNDL